MFSRDPCIMAEQPLICLVWKRSKIEFILLMTYNFVLWPIIFWWNFDDRNFFFLNSNRLILISMWLGWSKQSLAIQLKLEGATEEKSTIASFYLEWIQSNFEKLIFNNKNKQFTANKFEIKFSNFIQFQLIIDNENRSSSWSCYSSTSQPSKWSIGNIQSWYNSLFMVIGNI